MVAVLVSKINGSGMPSLKMECIFRERERRRKKREGKKEGKREEEE